MAFWSGFEGIEIACAPQLAKPLKVLDRGDGSRLPTKLAL